MAKEKQKLFSEFPPISAEAWVEKITADLKGASFEKRLIWRTNEGFDVNPFYRREDIQELKTTTSLPNEYPYVRSTRMNNEWLVRQDIVVGENVAEANEKALDLLNKGVDSLGFSLKKIHINAEALAALLKGIEPTAVELNFSCCITRAAELLPLIAAYFNSVGADVTKCRGSVSYDPFKKQLVRGVSHPDWVKMAAEVMEAAKGLPAFRVLNVNACNLSDAGAFITQELGYALAWGAEFLDKMTDAGYKPEEIASRIKFNFGIGSNYFMEIAKFRAARWLWAEIVGSYGDQYKNETAKIHQHATTSFWNKSIFDAHVNLLRTQTEAMSAAIGGVDSITVQPFDVTYQHSDDFSERIARNQQLLLKEECHFDKVIDPSAGSYYIETLTDSIAAEAWKLFLSVEEAGGFTQAAEAGMVQAAVNASNKKRHQSVATRREIFLGTNQFPNFTEVAGSKITLDGGEHECGCVKSIEPLDFSRGASEFEALRLSTEKSGKTPVVFMLTIGNLAMRLARSQFSCNFFACAGYKLIDNLGFKTVEEGVDAALAAKADIVVLCSSDDEYAEYAPAAFEYLAGRAEFVVAGAPACTPELEAKGIKNYIHVKSNVLETLRAFNDKFGIR
ncbi:methylmalonyl-CoA mutase small subunit [Porphyromonas loveana]|uniref:Methylmalonyl-CoA mutase small subunit n=3 Tax=Porphyromonas loveana TaxID=1884669 RepID=A0A2U1FHJ8_9PORP|nr:methylmalonyl-CoA mutase small subunit [Porphyromonas loveana]PVZ11664.1 heterodimeric methylmalonyl-CoA mutase small subunit [Porphyromonas loveana]